MVPIHDSDIAAERWAQAEWHHYELWEKIEVKLRRRRNLWVAATILVFLLLSSIPTWVDRWPKWMALSASRKLGEQINQLKREAGMENRAFRMEFAQDHLLSYSVFKVENCQAPMGSGSLVRGGTVLADSQGGYQLLSSQEGRELGLPGLVESICYDPLGGSFATQNPESIAGFGIIPVKDLTEKRSDRISLLIFKGPSAEVSFE